MATQAHLYGCEHRPPSENTLPAGPLDISTEPLTGHLAEVGRHGTVTYGERLDVETAERFSLWLILPVAELVAEIIAEIDYPKETLEEYEEEPLYFAMTVGLISDCLVARADISREDLATAVGDTMLAAQEI